MGTHEPYVTLRDRIDRFVESVRVRYGEQITCRPRCAECCTDDLTLTLVEAVAIGDALGILPDMVHLQAGQPPRGSGGRCALLGDDDLCTVYPVRPLICRTHGLPLQYPERDGISVCEKNFIYSMPHQSSVLDMKSLETVLFAANLDYCRKEGVNPLARVPIDRLAELAATGGDQRAARE